MNDVIRIYPKEGILECPCGGTTFNILVDGTGATWEHITGLRCVECKVALAFGELDPPPKEAA